MNKLAQILGIQFPNEIEISSITNTTDKVKEGSIFFALKGTQNHGSKYIDEAFEKGAKLAIHNDKNFYSSNENIPSLLFAPSPRTIARWLKAILSAQNPPVTRTGGLMKKEESSRASTSPRHLSRSRRSAQRK